MKTKQYTKEQEQIARFAKAMGHPARMAILNFLANRTVVSLGTSMKNYQLLKQLFHNI